MKKTIALLVLLVLVSGCQTGLFQRKDTMQLPEVNIGTQGVEPLFIQGTPPREVFEGSAFTMMVNLANLGTRDVDDGIYSLSYEQQYLYIAGQKNQGRFVVRGKSIFNPQGEERLLNFAFTTKSLGPQLQGYPVTITFNACYPYVTNAPLIVCIDTDVTGKKSGKVCTAQTQTFPRGQGAPVAVMSVETKILPHEMPNRARPEFVITIKNLGSGQVMASQLYREACSGRPLGEDAWNVVGVSATLSDSVLTCAPETIKMKQQGDTRIVCTQPEGIETRLGTYTAPLTVTLDYGYISSITTQVNIVKQ